MDLILILLIILVILAVVGGVYLSPLVWILAVILVIGAFLYYRRGSRG